MIQPPDETLLRKTAWFLWAYAKGDEYGLTIDQYKNMADDLISFLGIEEYLYPAYDFETQKFVKVFRIRGIEDALPKSE